MPLAGVFWRRGLYGYEEAVLSFGRPLFPEIYRLSVDGSGGVRDLFGRDLVAGDYVDLAGVTELGNNSDRLEFAPQSAEGVYRVSMPCQCPRSDPSIQEACSPSAWPRVSCRSMNSAQILTTSFDVALGFGQETVPP